MPHDEVNELVEHWLTRGLLSPEETSRLTEVLDQLLRLYQRHFAIEDTDIFPIAAKVLSPSDRDSVGAEMAARREIAVSIPRY